MIAAMQSPLFGRLLRAKIPVSTAVVLPEFEMPKARVTAAQHAVRALGIGALLLFAVTIFFPYLVGLVFPLPYVVFGALWVYGGTEVLHRFGPRLLFFGWVLVPGALAAFTYRLFSQPPGVRDLLGSWPEIFRDYFMIAPVAILAGVLAVKDPGIRWLLRFLRAAAAVSAIGAVYEWGTRTQLFPGNEVFGAFGAEDGVSGLLLPDGGLRAIVATDHPLVLAALLATMLPFVLRRPFSLLRLLEAVLILAGIYATDSNGPLIVAIVAIVIALLWPRRWLYRRIVPTPVVAGVTALGGVVFLAVSWFVLTPTLPASGDASSAYRLGLYALVPRIMFEGHPLGYGLAEVPTNTLFIDRGDKLFDVAKSVDSQLVLWVVQTGIVGFLLYLLIAFVALRGVSLGERGPLNALPLLVLTVCGAFLAIQPWASLSAFWMFLLGAAVFVRGPAEDDSQPDGARRRFTLL
ncbi:MAG: hypothetical protein JWP66_1892 [Naasia sp.]|nr:hypothetical protein [Naasia sp.]